MSHVSVSWCGVALCLRPGAASSVETARKEAPTVKRSSLVAVLSLLLATGVLAAAVPAAFAKIVIGQSIARVKLGDSQAAVKTLLGKPSVCRPACGPKAHEWSYTRGFMGVVTFDTHGHVQSLWTGSSHQATSSGIHPGAIGKPGSSVADIRRAYPAVKCEELPNSGGFTSCDLFSRLHGRKVDTNFLIKAASFGVAEITIGFG